MLVHAHHTEGVSGSERQEGSNGVGNGIGVGSGNGDGDGVGAGTGTGKRVEANEVARTDGAGMGAGLESSGRT